MSQEVSIKYIVNDLDEAIKFYTTMPDFKVEMHPAVKFAISSKGNLRLILSKPSSRGGGGQPMPDGTIQTPIFGRGYFLPFSGILSSPSALIRFRRVRMNSGSGS